MRERERKREREREREREKEKERKTVGTIAKTKMRKEDIMS